ncbi:sensor histidine kinase [Xaviernesmea oryzae]|nr:sensor histidine kinase [Xaviernesmea oryzae]
MAPLAPLGRLTLLMAGLRHSLRVQLLFGVMVTLTAVVGFNLTSGLISARRTALVVTDNMLLASARTIAEAVHVDGEGTVAVDVPPAALELFDTGHADHVYYRVTTAWGSLVTGYPDLASPAMARRGEDMAFHNVNVRAMMLDQPVVGLGPDATVTVTVAVTRHGQQAMRTALWLSGLKDQLLLVAMAGLVTVFGLRFGLSPIMRFRNVVKARRRDQLEPFDEAMVQTELRPLVAALNDYMGRAQRQMAAQRRFVANAAHQLRTPLTVLSTQASFAARETDSLRRDEALQALIRSTRQVTRLAEQLLTLTRAEPGSRAPRAERIDMAKVARQVLEAQAETALSRGIDIGLDVDNLAAGAAIVIGDGTMMKEALVNLVDNALRYTPGPGAVTVTLKRKDSLVEIIVDDTGPGIADTEREQVFERFYRIIGTQAEGSGLGLAIVREVVTGAGGTVALGESPEGGLRVTVRLPGA